jgi:hypothetical protein
MPRLMTDNQYEHFYSSGCGPSATGLGILGLGFYFRGWSGMIVINCTVLFTPSYPTSYLYFVRRQFLRSFRTGERRLVRESKSAHGPMR